MGHSLRAPPHGGHRGGTLLLDEDTRLLILRCTRLTTTVRFTLHLGGVLTHGRFDTDAYVLLELQC